MTRILQAGFVFLFSLIGGGQATAQLVGLGQSQGQPQQQQPPLQTQSTTTFRFGYILEKLGIPRLTPRPSPRQVIIVPDQSQPTFPILNRIGGFLPGSGRDR